MSASPVRVVFVTTVFEATDTGPGTFARYLWRAFRDDPDLEFHLVAPEVAEVHPRLHASGRGGGPLALYRRVQEMGLQIALSHERSAIVHGNATHSMGRFVTYPGPLLVQVNDYDVATSPRRAAAILFRRGPRRFLGSAWRFHHERRVLGAASLAICNSRYTASAVLHAYGIDSQRIRIVNKAVETQRFLRPADLAHTHDTGARGWPRLLFLGTDWRRKGLDVLLRSVSSLRGEFPDMRVSVAGPNPNEFALLDLLKKSEVADRVDLLGRIGPQAVASHLWQADAYVLPSRREALGVAVLEAMAAGVPVVASRVGGIPEIIRSEAEGLLVKPEDPAALAGALRRLLEHSELRKRLAGAGPARAEAFSVPSMTEAIKQIYLEIASGR